VRETGLGQLGYSWAKVGWARLRHGEQARVERPRGKKQKEKEKGRVGRLDFGPKGVWGFEKPFPFSLG
jgi:hypothetical protein